MRGLQCVSRLQGDIVVSEWALYVPSELITTESRIQQDPRFGKRLTWRQSQRGLVGSEKKVNSGLFSQLPVETKIIDYLLHCLKGYNTQVAKR